MNLWCRRAVALGAILPSLAHAQGDCFPSDDSNEAQTFAILSAPLTFSGAAGWQASNSVGLELASIPRVPDDIATPITCRPGKGPENTNPVPGFARLRLAVTLSGWRLEAGWIPPVPVSGMRSNLVGVGVSRLVPLGSGWMLAPRVHGLFGRVRGPITCNEDALQNNASECFEGTLSNDRWDPNLLGVEMMIAHHGSRLVPHAGVGWTTLRPRFQVGFTNSFGEVDRRKVEVDLQRVAVFGGASATTRTLKVTGEGYLTLGDRVAARVVARLPL